MNKAQALSLVIEQYHQTITPEDTLKIAQRYWEFLDECHCDDEDQSNEEDNKVLFRVVQKPKFIQFV